MFIGIDLSPVNPTKGGGVTYDADTSALFARWTTQPDATRKGLVDAVFKTPGIKPILAKLDFLHVYAAHDSQAARQNWLRDLFNATAIGGPTFTADRGYTGNGSSSYINTNFNPGDGGSYQYLLDSAHLGFWSRTELAATVFDIGSRGSSTTRLATILARLSGDNAGYRLNEDGGGTLAANASSIGHFVARRSGAGATALFKNGSSIGTGSVGSSVTGLQNASMFVGSVSQSGTPTTFSTRQYAVAHGGASLTDAEITALYGALSTYLTAIGA